MKNRAGFDVEILADKTMEILRVVPGQAMRILPARWARTCACGWPEDMFWWTPKPGRSAGPPRLAAASNGDKDLIAELGIVVNPGMLEPISNTSLEEKIGSGVDIAIGMNEWF